MKENFNYFKLTDKIDTEFTKTPKKLLHAKISPFARILCIAMLERLSLSVQNKWADDNGNVYIFYTVKEAMELLGCSKPKAINVFAELDGRFIKRKRQGLGKADIIYINQNFGMEEQGMSEDVALSTDNVENSKSEALEPLKENILNFKNDTSRSFNLKHPEVNNFDPNNINNNKNKINKNNLNYLIYPIFQYMEGG